MIRMFFVLILTLTLILTAPAEMIVKYDFENGLKPITGLDKFPNLTAANGVSLETTDGRQGISLTDKANLHAMSDYNFKGRNEYTLLLWVKSLGIQGTLAWGLIGRGKCAGGPQINVGFTDADKNFFTLISNFNKDVHDGIDGNIEAFDNAWNHIAVVISENAFIVYFNGDFIGEVQRGIAFTFDCPKTVVYLASGGFGLHFVDDLTLFESALDAAAVAAIYEGEPADDVQVLPVNPTGMLTQTWADVKKGD